MSSEGGSKSLPNTFSYPKKGLAIPRYLTDAYFSCFLEASVTEMLYFHILTALFHLASSYFLSYFKFSLQPYFCLISWIILFLTTVAFCSFPRRKEIWWWLFLGKKNQQPHTLIPHVFYITFFLSISLDFPNDFLHAVHPPAWSAVNGKMEVNGRGGWGEGGWNYRFMSAKTSQVLITTMWIHRDKKKKKNKQKTCPVEAALNSLLLFCCNNLYFPVFLHVF